jgi:hypothetical protein
MKIYHYTKGIHLKSIYKDGFIVTEQKRNLNTQDRFFTDLVWLTESKKIPTTAIPEILGIPSTHTHILEKIKNVKIDYVAIEPFFGGFYRFGFDSSDHNFEKWFFSNARKEVFQRSDGFSLERSAKKVGDDIRLFWISEQDIPLENFTLERFLTADNRWIDVELSSIVL